MDPNMIAQLLGGQGGQGGQNTPPIPPTPSTPPTSQGVGQADTPWMPFLEQALTKLQNMGVPFVGDISHLISKGGGSQQSWNTLLKTIDSYGKHKDSVAADNVPGIMDQANQVQPPGSYS